MHWWERVGAWGEAHRSAVDALGAALLLLLVVPLTTTFIGGDPVDATIMLAFSVLLIAPLIWRRTHPAASAAAVFGIALAHMVAGFPMILPADLVVLLALFSVTVHGPVWAYRTAFAGCLLGAALVVPAMAGHPLWLGDGWTSAVVIVVSSLSVFAIALVRRSRREAIDFLVERARQLEVERDQQAQLATAAERTRIAREMHDIVAHSLSVIIAQADGGRYAAAADPAAAGRSLTTIAETGRAALADMRRLLGVLRPDAAAPAAPTGSDRSGPAPQVSAPAAVTELAPQPAVDDIAALVEQVRGSGVRASLVRMGSARPLPPGTGLTVYRICQESLTNVLKHAGPDPAVTVLLQWGAAALTLEVTDDGRGAAAQGDGAGQGVLGMRERAAMLGGSLSVGPRPGGGFRVRAEIPLPAVQEAS